MFPLNNKKYNINTRYREKYKVLPATSKRLKNSAIPFMQELLNKEYRNSSNICTNYYKM